jgi:hypothetical protein
MYPRSQLSQFVAAPRYFLKNPNAASKLKRGLKWKKLIIAQFVIDFDYWFYFCLLPLVDTFCVDTILL